MSSAAVSPVSQVTLLGYAGKAVYNALAIPANAIYGLGRGACEGAFAQGAGKLEPICEGYKASKTTGEFIQRFFRDNIGHVFAKGINSIRTSELGSKVKKLFSSTNGAQAKAALTGFSQALGKCGPYGIPLLIGNLVLGGLAITMGAKLAWTSYQEVNNIKKNQSVDLVQNSLIHGLQSAFAAQTAIGGLLMLANPMGWAVMGTGLIGVLTMFATRHLMGGLHIFNHPNSAIWPFNKILTWFTNNDRFYSGYN